MQLHLIRHPRPIVEEGVCYGSSDLAVSSDVIQQTLAALPALPPGLPLFSSPLRRCSEFALSLACARNFPSPAPDERLRELDFGTWELRSWETIPRVEIDAWAADPIHYCPGGGESVIEALQRVRSFLGDLQAQQTDAVVICHAGTIRLLRACLLYPEPEAASLHAVQQTAAIPYGQLSLLVC